VCWKSAKSEVISEINAVEDTRNESSSGFVLQYVIFDRISEFSEWKNIRFDEW
jgi:hypothetical protein